MKSETILAQRGDRLDKIVFENYGTLKVMPQVLKANPHLQTKVLLDDGDIINLPKITIKEEKKVKTLW